jgi:L,D-peptidoglycan transpeptidase YkuD (ErfK/YbiS/YcfS/YnhG family)
MIGSLNVPCAVGRSGVKALKREGDGATPAGRYQARFGYIRRDRIMHPHTGLPLRPLKPRDGWCDAPSDRNYNRRVAIPYPASAERLWRDDRLYDIIIVLSYNERPRVRGRGSAVFMHVAREGLAPTEGCVALRRADLKRVLALLGRRATVPIGGV